MKPLRLIIVEDSEDDALLLILELKKGGYEPDHLRVETAASLEAALNNGTWDLILSDHALPAFSAPEALNLLNKSGKEIPFIIVSSVIGEDVAVSAMNAGAHDYIMKSSPARLVPVIERALHDSEVRAERKKALLDLRESEARFRRIAENALDIIYRVRISPSLKIEYLSPSVEAFIGFPADYFYDNPNAAFERVYEQDRHILEASLKGEKLFSKPILTRWVHRDGSVNWLEQRNVPIYDRVGRLVFVEGIARDITERILYEQELKKNHARIEALSNRILGAMEEERSRLARELHDELGQALTAVKLDLQLFNEGLSASQAQQYSLKQSIDLVDHTINLVRRQSVSLRPPVLDDMGLLPAVKEMVRGFMNRTGIQTKITADGFSRRLSKSVETALYRCVQESLTNVVRHARARNVSVRFNKENGLLVLSVADDGIGFEPEKMEVHSEHIGLTGMKERVKLLDGCFTINSAPQKGTTVSIKIPWQDRVEGEAGL